MSSSPRKKARRPGIVENDEYAEFARRVISAYARRVAQGDVDALPGLYRLADEVNSMLATAAVRLHDDAGYSWTDIARRIGISRQAAQQRWSRVRPGSPPPR